MPSSLGNMAALPWEGPVTSSGVKTEALKDLAEGLNLAEWLTLDSEGQRIIGL